ncbi:hypothetical protein PanWU01x14_343590 [Parasponia andersonii]|uniref:Uncharacterized protein n=1 Tax=Parasponia andersonii TaxID=3476 RepID=A0A2P5ADB4_PARAD|nr:hypothetical protein PanWU01x14_343590 [Parasponia andersonii]
MSSHGSAPLATSAASGSNSRDDRYDPKGKRLREETRGFSVKKGLRRLKTDRLKVEFCEKTGKPILDHGKMFLNILAQMDMKKEDIELILNRMEVRLAQYDAESLYENGVKKDMAFIKANPYKNVLFDQWNILCDHFGSQEFDAMISQMKVKGNSEIGELMSPIDYFKSRHLRPSDWQNEYTQEKHSELGDGALSAESVVGPEQVDEFQIMSKALKTKSRW